MPDAKSSRPALYHSRMPRKRHVRHPRLPPQPALRLQGPIINNWHTAVDRWFNFQFLFQRYKFTMKTLRIMVGDTGFKYQPVLNNSISKHSLGPAQIVLIQTHNVFIGRNACWMKAQRGSGCIVCNELTPVRSCNGATLSPPARSDCWGCALRHGTATVRSQVGAALFPCYCTDAARNLLTTAVRHAAARSAGVKSHATRRQGGQNSHLSCRVLNNWCVRHLPARSPGLGSPSLTWRHKGSPPHRRPRVRSLASHKCSQVEK
jgi:hypothetical protein